MLSIFIAGCFSVKEENKGTDDTEGDGNSSLDSGSRTPSGEQIEVKVTEKGGELNLEKMWVEIPRGALDEEVEISIKVVEPPVSIPDKYKLAGEIYECTPHGLDFKKPINLEIGYKDRTDDTFRVLYLSDDKDKSWEVLGSPSFNESIAHLKVDHFSYYTVVYEDAGTSASFADSGEQASGAGGSGDIDAGRSTATGDGATSVTGGESDGSGGEAGTPTHTGTTSFSAKLLESVNEVPVTDMGVNLKFTILAIDNTTGQPIPGFETISDDKSWVFFDNLPAGLVAFKVLGIENQSIDTYQFNYDANDQNEELWVVARSSVEMAPILGNVILNSEKAIASGSIYWINPDGGKEPVGCATVRIDSSEGEIRYFGTTNVFRQDAPNQEVRTDSNPLNGKYFIANVTAGRYTVTTMLNGKNIGSTSLMLFRGDESIDGEYAISLGDIYVEGQSANPTPDDCI